MKEIVDLMVWYCSALLINSYNKQPLSLLLRMCVFFFFGGRRSYNYTPREITYVVEYSQLGYTK